MGYSLFLAAVVVLIVGTCATLAFPDTPVPLTTMERNVRVVDGDTFMTERGEVVTTMNASATSLFEPGGYTAKAALIELVRPGVRVQRQGYDEHGFTLACVYTAHQDVGEAMIDAGFALRVRECP